MNALTASYDTLVVRANPFALPFDFRALAKSVSDDLDLSVDEVLSRKRFRELSSARAVIIMLCLDRGWSATQIGRKLDRDHTSVIHARQNFTGYCKLNPAVRETYDRHRALMQGVS